MNLDNIGNLNKGIFVVPEEISREPKLMAFFFTHFRPLRYDLEISEGQYYILAESVMFDEIGEGEGIPIYTLKAKEDENGDIQLVDIVKGYKNHE